MAITVKEHAVSATRIAQVQPLRGNGGGPMSPDAGLLIVLEDGSKRKWLLDANAPVPAPGMWLIHDDILKTDSVVSAEQFSELFTIVPD
jgi:hypothetical protein